LQALGRKPLLAVTLLVYGLAGEFELWLNSRRLIVGASIVGLSECGIMTTATTLIADYYTGSAVQNFFELQAAFMALGESCFSLRWLSADVSWRMHF